MLEALQTAAHAGGLGAQVITGMPHASGAQDKVGNLVIEMEDVLEELVRLEAEMEQVKQKITSYIETIPDIQTRLIFRLRFLRCMTWDEVAAAIGGRNTGKNVSNRCYRYLESGGTGRK